MQHLMDTSTAVKATPPAATAPTLSFAQAAAEQRAAETQFLKHLGQRVRAFRLHRGMSRKALSGQSGISERYIAQLESGKGNVSIVLLRRISSALGAGVGTLLPS
jgi:XRE family aerobic/anaerobic benzoate catabolism transcriptional regulator